MILFLSFVPGRAALRPSPPRGARGPRTGGRPVGTELEKRVELNGAMPFFFLFLFFVGGNREGNCSVRQLAEVKVSKGRKGEGGMSKKSEQAWLAAGKRKEEGRKKKRINECSFPKVKEERKK